MEIFDWCPFLASKDIVSTLFSHTPNEVRLQLQPVPEFATVTAYANHCFAPSCTASTIITVRAVFVAVSHTQLLLRAKICMPEGRAGGALHYAKHLNWYASP